MTQPDNKAPEGQHEYQNVPDEIWLTPDYENELYDEWNDYEHELTFWSEDELDRRYSVKYIRAAHVATTEAQLRAEVEQARELMISLMAAIDEDYEFATDTYMKAQEFLRKTAKP